MIVRRIPDSPRVRYSRLLTAANERASYWLRRDRAIGIWWYNRAHAIRERMAAQ